LAESGEPNVKAVSQVHGPQDTPRGISGVSMALG
jgi:hypothetical protein